MSAAVVMQLLVKRGIGGEGRPRQKKQRQQTGQHRPGQSVTLEECQFLAQLPSTYTTNPFLRKR